MAEIVVFPCCAGKERRYWKNHKGKQVVFVAHPCQCGESSEFLYCHPDDTNTDTGKTWREELEEYNKYYQRTTKNPFGLCKAYELYEPKYHKTIYKELYKNFGERLFILSAGWGLVGADYLLPHYDITFKGNACNRRTKQRKYSDFNHLSSSIQQDDIVLFPGLNDYIDLFNKLTKGLNRKQIKVWGNKKYGFYGYKTHTGWQYVWARDLINGVIDP